MTEYRRGLPEVPERMRKLPVDERGYPIPAFVAWIDGKPDFRAADARHQHNCIRFGHCWVCGDRLGTFMTFVIGPMCALNRNTAEPPSHLECARFSALACPVLTRPEARCDRGKELLGTTVPVPGIALPGNPGVTLLWTTKGYNLEREQNGYLFKLGDPVHLEYYREGRAATRAEVLECLDRRLPLLQPYAEADGPEAVAELQRRYDHFVNVLAPA